MINIFMKQSTCVVSHRISQLIGTMEGADCHQRYSELYSLFFTEDNQLKDYSICSWQLDVTVISAIDLPKADVVGSVDPLCLLECAGAVHQTTKKMREYNPIWKNEIYSFEMKKDNTSSLTIKVLDWDRFQSNTTIGSVEISSEVLNSIFASSSEDSNELEMQLSYNGEHVVNAEGSPSKLNIRLKNAGLVISGCAFSDIKTFFHTFDTDGDGIVSKDEFFGMMRQISETSRLFTGSENGDMKMLSVAQVSALLSHNWEPCNKQVSPLVSMISNIKNHAEQKNRSYDNDSEAAGDQIQELEKACNDEACEPTKAVDHDVKTIEELHHDLEMLAKKLRKFKIIALPTLLWGTETDSSPDSLENTAIR
jgi:hypothetical protein